MPALIPKNLKYYDNYFLVRYNAISDYFKETGSTYIKVNTIYKGLKLGSYVKNLRDQYKKGKLKEWKIRLLNDIGFRWDEHEYKSGVKTQKNIQKLKNTFKGLIPKKVKKYFDEIKGYSKVKGTRYYLRYLHISQYVNLDTYEILKDFDLNTYLKDLYSKDPVVETEAIL